MKFSSYLKSLFISCLVFSAASIFCMESWLNVPTDKCIRFYDKNEPYYEFTNFTDGYPITIDGETWDTVEQYYQAMKFNGNPQYQRIIREFKTNNNDSAAKNVSAARKAFNFAQSHKNAKRKDWKNVSLRVMEKALVAKFSQHPQLQKRLLDTNDLILIEDAGKYDTFYGAGRDGEGKNHLGQLLMNIRERFKHGKKIEYVSKAPSQYFNKSQQPQHHQPDTQKTLNDVNWLASLSTNQKWLIGICGVGVIGCLILGIIAIQRNKLQKIKIPLLFNYLFY